MHPRDKHELLLIAALVVCVVVYLCILAGGLYWYRSNQ